MCKGVRVLFCAIPSHLVLTLATVFCLPLQRLLCPFPLAVVDFLSSFQIAQQPFLSIISSAMPDWYNDHDFRHCGSDNESKICNGSPSLQSALWQSESCSVKERERILHRLHCAKAGLSFVVSLALPQPPSALPVQCSTVHCAPVPPSVVPMDSGPPQALSRT